MKSKKFILGLIAFLAIYILICGYFSFIKPPLRLTSPQPSPYKGEGELRSGFGEERGGDQGLIATLEVNGIKYNGEVSNQTSVYDLMKEIQNKKPARPSGAGGENNFNFKVKEYPGMGFFVEEINGIKGNTGKFWIYYVNGEKASVGISKYILKSGDVITWKQESSF